MNPAFKQLVAACLLLALGAFGAADEPDTTPAPSGLGRVLPAVSTLDSLGGKGASAIVDDIKDVSDVVAAEFSTGTPAGWVFQDQPFHSWVLYRLPAPVGGDPPLAIRALGSPRLWMVVADYATGRWVRPQQLGQTLTQYDLTLLGDPVSPGGFIYVGFVLTQSTGGLDDRISMLGLRYDNLANPPVFYVAPESAGGDDANPGTQAAPWETLQHAADTVMPGDSVVVLAGEYTGFHLQTSGLPGQPITFAGQPGARIVDRNDNTNDGINVENWDGPPSISYVTIEGFTVDGTDFPAPPRAGIRIVGSDTSFAHHIVVRNNTCVNCDRWGIFDGHVDDVLYEGNECAWSYHEHGIYHSNSGDRATFRGNYLHHNHGCGIHTNGDLSAGGDGIISDCLYENNIIFENGLANDLGAGGGSAINCDGVQDSVIRNNLLFDNHASGISFYQIDAGAAASGNFVTNNTIVMAADGRWAVNIQDASTGATLRNNILMNRHPTRGSIDIGASSLAGFTSNSNVVMDRFTVDGDAFIGLVAWQADTGQDMASLTAQPADLFFNPLGTQAEEYQLKPTSLALEAGGAQNAPTVDMRGVPRPAGAEFDAGCFEMEAPIAGP